MYRPPGELVAPAEHRTIQSAARGKLPFGLSRQFLPRPGGVRSRVLEGDMHRRFLLASFERAGGTVGWRQFAPGT